MTLKELVSQTAKSAVHLLGVHFPSDEEWQYREIPLPYSLAVEVFIFNVDSNTKTVCKLKFDISVEPMRFNFDLYNPEDSLRGNNISLGCRADLDSLAYDVNKQLLYSPKKDYPEWL